MSMQIRFFHSEQDSLAFAEELGKYPCQMFDQAGNLCKEPEITLHEDMQTEGHMFWLAKSPAFLSAGRAIELNNCAKGNPASRTYRDGRLYLTKTEENCYDDDMKRIFEGLRKYIRKNYIYSPENRLYFGPDFYAKYSQNRYFALYGKVTPIIFSKP